MSSFCRFRTGLIAIALLLVPPAIAQIPNSPQGFDQQFQAVFEAYKKGDGDLMKSRLNGFAIPKHWFTDVFDQLRAPAITRRYNEQFADFDSRTVDNLLHFDRANADKLDIVLTPDSRPKPQTKPAPASLVPLPDGKRFLINYRAKHPVITPNGTPDQSVEWMDTFVYVDGQFRYFGGGAYPFWDPARTPRADPCAGPGGQTGGQLVSRIDPIYPDEAGQRHIEGVVKMHVTVSEDGSVKQVVVVEGNPLLVASAKAAVMQWRYLPLMKCGHRVQMRTVEQVTFSAH